MDIVAMLTEDQKGSVVVTKEYIEAVANFAMDTKSYDMFKSATKAIMKSVNKAKKLFKKGDKVLIYEEFTGVVVGYNTSGGFYDGERYPVIVKVTKPNFEEDNQLLVTYEFEYGIEALSKF